MTSILTFASLKTLKKVHSHSVLLSKKKGFLPPLWWGMGRVKKKREHWKTKGCSPYYSYKSQRIAQNLGSKPFADVNAQLPTMLATHIAREVWPPTCQKKSIGGLMFLRCALDCLPYFHHVFAMLRRFVTVRFCHLLGPSLAICSTRMCGFLDGGLWKHDVLVKFLAHRFLRG